MPLFDAMWNTLNCNSWHHTTKLLQIQGKREGAGFCVLAHVVDIMSAMHVPFDQIIRIHTLLHKDLSTAVLAVYVYAEGINKLIEEAILRADRMGVKVISLAALNKEVFLTGATSKLGRAIALYLCRNRVRVLMLTSSTERFQKIKKEASEDTQNYLVQVTKYHAAQNWSNIGLHPEHIFTIVVPPILSFRRDCTYGELAAMRLPHDVEGLGNCEYTMERGVVHACHAGGVIHQLEGWTHHEVGD
ncbi:Detected protein of unknown function [Hibiscus syriacus]|uniref:Very-long-chain aldehyde decarbonylase CER1-like C-terminal domain-containing protein n=1 Tax=Hibiscus syriacus TaxID=106335 RepID=A0A6A3A525_HIBSY|nr:Detected protein of unknown function [Hibiscus syriacus]